MGYKFCRLMEANNLFYFSMIELVSQVPISIRYYQIFFSSFWVKTKLVTFFSISLSLPSLQGLGLREMCYSLGGTAWL